MPRKPFRRTKSGISGARRVKILRAASLIRQGKTVAHTTSTIPGVAALPDSKGLERVHAFKGRQGPFILLAASASHAAKLGRYFSPLLRRQMKSVWPGATTLVFPGRPSMPEPIYLKGKIAVRVDADGGVRLLAQACGGLLLSSSLNKRGQLWRLPERHLRMRWHRYLDGIETGGECSGRPSRVIEICRSGERVLRP